MMLGDDIWVRRRYLVRGVPDKMEHEVKMNIASFQETQRVVKESRLKILRRDDKCCIFPSVVWV